MRRDPDGSIVLSKRNLLTLLSKVDDDSSRKTLTAAGGGENGVGDLIIVKCETDEVHYAARPSAGEVHPNAETFIATWPHGSRLRDLVVRWRYLAANSESLGGTSMRFCADELDALLRASHEGKKD